VVNFAPRALNVAPVARDQQLGIVLHEITHALGYGLPLWILSLLHLLLIMLSIRFSRSKFQYSGFIKWVDATSWIHLNSSDVMVIFRFQPSSL